MKKSYFPKIVFRSATIVLIAFASIYAALAQAEDFPNFKTTLTGKGIMLMNQKGAPDYAVLIEGGTEARHDAADDSVRIKITGGSEVAAYYADAKLYAKTKTKINAPETLMKNYRASQIAQLETEKKQKIMIDEDFSGELPVFDMREGKDTKIPVYSSFWSFPLSGARPERRMYLAVIIGDSFLILRKDLFKGENAQEQSGGFVGALKTLTLLPPQEIDAAPKKIDAAPKKKPVKPSRKKT